MARVSSSEKPLAMRSMTVADRSPVRNARMAATISSGARPASGRIAVAPVPARGWQPEQAAAPAGAAGCAMADVTASSRMAIAAAFVVIRALAARRWPAPVGAAACSGCHPGTGAGAPAVQPLAGRAPDEIVAAMQAFRTGERSATIMDRIAKGFSDDETRAIAAWVSAQR